MTEGEAVGDEDIHLRRPPSSVVGPGLVPRDSERPPLWEDLGLDDTRKAAFAWQTFRSRGETLEMHAVLHYGPPRCDWVREIVGLAGMVGELVIVAMEAESEKAQLAATATDPGASGYAWRRRSAPLLRGRAVQLPRRDRPSPGQPGRPRLGPSPLVLPA